MRASEFLIKLTDLVDCIEKMTIDPPEKSTDETTPEQSTMIPPLQQKIEILKKVANIDSFYDNPEEDKPSDELKRMQANAGILPTMIDDEVTECLSIPKK